jgi:hypothetical protein
MRGVSVLGILLGMVAALAAAGTRPLSDTDIMSAFGRQGIRLDAGEAAAIRADVRLALDEARAHGIGNGKVDFAAVEIASRLGLDTSPGSSTVRNVVGALRELHEHGRPSVPPEAVRVEPPLAWNRYFEGTVGLWNDASFMGLVRRKGFHPVKVGWEDVGRYQGSVWGDRISDVGIWVRQDEGDPASARLALSVRRDSNFRDKVLVVPASAIKVHRPVRGRTIERTLPERLAELGLASPGRDRNVIVSKQFAVVPVPARRMRGAWPEGVPPRAAFTFSIFPYGSTNFVITDVIEGSHEAIVGPGQHQLLFANVDGQRTPFTASRAEDRQDLLKMERELRAQGMDVDVQRYYLIQVPLRRDATGLRPSNMGTPPWSRFENEPVALGVTDAPTGANLPGGVVGGVVGGMPDQAPSVLSAPERQPTPEASVAEKAKAGLARVAIGHGEPEGPYSMGGGFRGARAEEPIRVTVVYFVTPVGAVTRTDMERFATAFERWDGQAIWGGSFVTKETF